MSSVTSVPNQAGTAEARPVCPPLLPRHLGSAPHPPSRHAVTGKTLREQPARRGAERHSSEFKPNSGASRQHSQVLKSPRRGQMTAAWLQFSSAHMPTFYRLHLMSNLILKLSYSRIPSFCNAAYFMYWFDFEMIFFKHF